MTDRETRHIRFVPGIGSREWFTIFLLVVEIVVFGFVSKNFFTGANLAAVLRNSTHLAIVAIGMNIVMLMGGVDISVGPAMGIAAIIAGWMLTAGIGLRLIFPAAVAVGIIIGMANGLIITRGRIPDIIATLGMMNILRAAVFAMLGGRWLTGLSSDFAVLNSGDILGVPSSAWLLILFFGFFWFLLTYTRFGRHVYAIGNNTEAAELAGINVRLVRTVGYGILGGLVGFSALLYLGRMGSVEITIGMTLHIEAIAAVVLGGTSVKGGSGHIAGTLAGVLFMAVLRNGVVLLGIPSLWERAVIGFLILISVGIDFFLSRRRMERRRLQLAAEKGLTVTQGNCS